MPTQSFLAQHLGISTARTSRLVAVGMPTTSVDDARSWLDDHVASHKVRAPRSGGSKGRPRPTGHVTPAVGIAPKPGPSASDAVYLEARISREQAAAGLARLAFEKACAGLVDRAEVAAAFAKQVAAIRAQLLELPAHLAPLVAGQSELATIQRTLMAEIRAALEAVARGTGPAP